ncbi:hypothetical protein EW146_g6937 [Bondarzewia mesenterica]|uniref:Non-ribosomal peptide synthetase n=1 Tax=Bondarzewia mesenterica TaxID=1095465 RepID=A0A4S4LMB8_9AGAM|nr:hypothetical protein EW146_g6937 [Bondarzewia mesenterica]
MSQSAVEDPEKGKMDVVLPSPLPPTHINDSRIQDSNTTTKSEISVVPALPAVQIHSKKPKKRAGLRVRALLWFNTYRKFYTFIVALNGVGILLAVIGKWQYPRRYTGAFVLGNLLVAILMRNELFGRLLYLLVNTLFAKWTPLWFRLGCTSVLQHLGGIHSGCASSGFAWLIFRVTLIFINHKDNHDAILIMGVITNLAVAISVASAFPWVRNTHHKWNPDGTTILRQQDFWFAFGMTIFIMIPWFTVREVKVDVEVPSPKVAILRFERGMQQGLLARVSRSSVMEYHAFGIISEGTHAKYHYLICGVQGDFTRSLVNDSPTHLWTRQLKFAGVSNTSTLYHRGIRVCTGTGIGAALSTCLQNPNWYLIWIGSDQEKTFGPTIAGLVYRHIGLERMCLWDSKQRGGRPDVMKLVKETYASWNAEVVFITSNYQGNTEIMEGCKEAGIPAFGTLWDF